MNDIKERAGRKEWIGLAVLVLPCLLVSMDMSVLFFALPFISEDLAPSGTEQLWIMDMYGFVLAGMLITMGALGDRVGRRKLLLIGAAAFGAASVTAAYATNPEMLIATRALLGLAGATLMPSTLALVRNMFRDARQRKTAIAIWTGGMTSGAIIGPITGGFLLDHFWWGAAFLINVPAMALLLILGPILLPEFRAPQAGRFDLISAAMSLVGMLALIYGIKEIAVDGFQALPVLSVIAGLLIGAAFVRRQQTHPHPLIDVKLFRNRAFSGSMLVNTVGMFAFIGITMYTNQYLQLVKDMSPFTAALWSLAVMPAVMVAMTISGILSSKVRPAYIIGAGLALMAAGFVTLSVLAADSPLWVVLTGAALVAAGVLTSTMLTADLILAAAPPERAGAASALSETGSELGGALGMAILGSIAAAVYHHQMAGSVPAARETLGGAVVTAAHLPGQAGQDLLDTARTAFTHGMNSAAIGAAIVVTAMAIAGPILLRRLPAVSPAPKTEPEAELVA